MNSTGEGELPTYTFPCNFPFVLCGFPAKIKQSELMKKLEKNRRKGLKLCQQIHFAELFILSVPPLTMLQCYKLAAKIYIHVWPLNAFIFIF